MEENLLSGKDLRVINTGTLLALNAKAVKLGYNRQLDSERLIENVDPDGSHIVKAFMLHEHAAGVKVDPHIRCMVFIKVKDTMEPTEGWLDVPLADYLNLEVIHTARA